MQKRKKQQAHKLPFYYSNKKLYCEYVSISDLIEEHGSPLYIYSKSHITNKVRTLQSSLSNSKTDFDIHYAMKASSTHAILKHFVSLGCGLDIVSGGELFRAILAGCSPKKIVFSGVGKSEKEIREALLAKIKAIHVESVSELVLIEKIASSLKVVAPICFRVNPNVDAKTHPYISTGLKKNKFGLSQNELKECYSILKNLTSIHPIGLTCHIGSQITSLAPFKKSWESIIQLATKAPFNVEHINIGGGLGISYTSDDEAPSIQIFASELKKFFKNYSYKVGLELGRSLIADSCVLATSVIQKKIRSKKIIYVLDAGMNDLIRPALYQAHHNFLPIVESKQLKKKKSDFVGPVCETSDIFLNDVNASNLDIGDSIVFLNAGAYGMSMASQYNSRPLPAEIWVEKETVTVLRNKETYDDLIKN